MLILCITLSAMAPPDILSPIKHPRYFTLELRLISISPYFMLSLLMFFFLNLDEKSIDFVSHILEKCTLTKKT